MRNITGLFMCRSFHVLLLGGVGFIGVMRLPAAPAESVVTERGPHHAVHHWTTEEVWPDGQSRPQEHYVVELASGLNFLKNGQWIPSKQEIEIFQGAAIARQGQHQVIFAANLNSAGAIDLATPDGKRFRSHILGLAYTDSASGKSVMIAEVKDSIGAVLPPNQVIYQDAFAGDCVADVRFTYTLGGFEQDVVLLTAPPSPAEWNLSPETTRLEVWTEFLELPEGAATRVVLKQEGDPAARQRMAEPDLIDQRLDFGVMKLEQGQAFPLGDTEHPSGAAVPTGKSMERIDGRVFLIEKVDYRDIREHLKTLPQQAAVKPPRKAGDPANGRKMFAGRLTASKGERGTWNEKQFAKAAPNRKAFLLDYITLNSSLTNYTFKADTTYYISGAANLYGTNYLEGGTVIKFAQGAGAVIDVKGKLVGDTDTYRPAVLTASADATVGEAIGGTLSGYYASPALNFDYVTSGQLASLQNLRILYAVTGVKFNGGSGHELRHLQLVNCGDAVRADNAQYAIRNALGWNLTNALTGSTSTGVWEHATFDGVTNLLASAVGQFTNCLLAAVVNTTGLSGDGNTVLAGSGGAFKTVGFGYHYLADGSVLRDAGVTNINATLAAELKKRTTFAPIPLPNITSNLTLLTKAERDTGPPDVGWHYAPLDYYASAIVVTNATVVMTNGVALGLDLAASWGLDLRTGTWISAGTPISPNYIVRAHMAQEKSGGNPATRACFYDGNSAGSTRACAVRMRFTEFSQLAADGNLVSVGTKFTDLEWLHSRIYNPSLVVETSGTGTFVAGLTNSLWERGAVQFGIATASGASVTVHLRNNLARNLGWNFFKGTTSWTIRDNLFDSMVVLTNNGVVVQNWTNAYYNTAWGLSSGVGNTNLASLSYEVGPLGKYYLPTNSVLINKGTRNATNAMLYQFTTTTNQVKETNSIVDIGLHFVALNASNLPMDTDGEGLPDYFEDANGDGFINTGESSWTNADTDGDGVSDYLEYLLGRNPTVAGSTNDVNNKINLRLYTPLK